MASVCDLAERAMEYLWHQCLLISRTKERRDSSWTEAIDTLQERVGRFQNEFRCLRIFWDCIHRWSDLEDVLHLGSLVSILEAKIQEIAKKLINNRDLLLASLSSDSLTSTLLRKIEDRSRKRKVSKLDDLFSGLMAEVMDLIPEIRKAYDSLTSLSFQFIFDHYQWEEFGQFVIYYAEACRERAGFYGSHLNKQFQDLNHNLVSAKNFLDYLAKSSSVDPKTKDAMIHVGRVAVGAALGFCERWAGQMDPNKSVKVNLLELQQKVDPFTPELLGMNLRLLTKAQFTEDQLIRGRLKNPVNKFVEVFLPSLKERESNFNLGQGSTLNEEVKSLIISVMNEPREDADNVQRRLADAKVVFTVVRKLSTLSGPSDRFTLIRNLLPDIWLIKLDIFLREQLNTDQSLQMPMEEQINAINRGLEKLNYEGWLKFLKTQKQSLTLMEEVGKVVQSLDHFIHAEEITIGKDMVRNELFKLILLIVLFKADSLVMNFQNNNNSQSLLAFDKNQIEALHKGLDFLIIFVKNQPAGAVVEAKLEFARIQEVAYQVSSLYHSLPANKITEEAIKDMNLFVSDLLEKIRLVMVELRDVYLHIPRHFPKTNGLGFFNSLLEKLRELLKADLAAFLKYQINEILEHLMFLTPFLRGILEQDNEFQDVKDLSEHIIDVAYKAEYYIDLMMLEDYVEWQKSLWLYHLQEDIRLMRTHVIAIYNEAPGAKGQDMHQTSAHKEPKATTSRIDETVVVLNDQEEMIIDRLLWGTPQLDIVPIIGMPGIGKTTLAKQVYDSPEVVAHFQIRTWCCISQIYRKREVLLEILSHITALSDDILRMSDQDLDFKLKKLLLKNKFLIVMDDMWNTEALDDLGASLPNDGNGSRILLTSRHNHVALKANPLSDPHSLRQLSDAESWSMLQKKIFHQELCPEELRHVGQQIAKSCKGLPLAIVAVSGILEKTERQYDSWKGIAEDLSFRIIDDPEEQCRKILELSYKHLPDYLKACFLYFGAFLEDQDIPSRKLMQLWICEGFVQKTEFNSLEDIAEEYLKDLIGRSLVVFSQRRSRGGAKTCRVHDVLQKFCQSKAKEDKFLRVITGFGESNVSLDDIGYVVHANFSNPSSSITCEDHRLSLSKQFIESRPSGPHVRSLLCFATNDKDPKRPYDMSFISQNFRFLKTLDLECINMGTSFPTGIERLLHLRYLAVAGYIDSVPSSIAKLRNLETFIVKGLKGQVNLPNTIWRMKRLRHVHVSGFAVISVQDDGLRNSSQLDYLISISSIFLRFGEETEHILMKISNVQKLKCIFSDCWDSSQNNFPRLDGLNQLESLKISYYGLAHHPSDLSFPLNLKKLTLSNFCLPWDKISVIGQLQNLEVLKLLSKAFVGESWDMVEGEFPELKYLKLDTLDIAKWNACSDHLPKLEQVVLRCCMRLGEVPSSFVEIPTLQRIDVQWCGNRLEESVRQIKDEGDEKLKVFINFAELDFSFTKWLVAM